MFFFYICQNETLGNGHDFNVKIKKEADVKNKYT